MLAAAIFAVTVTAPTHSYTLGQDVHLRVTVRNVSPARQTILVSDACSYRITVTDANGIVLFSGCPSTDIYYVSARTVDPGEALEFDLPLTRDVAIHEPGSYEVLADGVLSEAGKPFQPAEVEATPATVLFKR